MNKQISFGMHEGKTFEWLFFNAPWYAEWIHSNGIHQQEHTMDEQERAYFEELWRRAMRLSGTCFHCKDRLTRMGLSIHHRSGQLGAVRLYCADCEYQGGSPTEYHKPSFFVDAYDMPRCEHLRITREIKNHFIGTEGNLTQAKMETFFRTDEFFPHGRPRFFNELAAEASR